MRRQIVKQLKVVSRSHRITKRTALQRQPRTMGRA